MDTVMATRVKLVRAISSTLRDDRCHGLTDEQIRDNIVAIRGEGVAWNHCLDWAAWARPGDDVREMARLFLVLKPHADANA